jgi:glycerophosphoryl diester phosphodiesterase
MRKAMTFLVSVTAGITLGIGATAEPAHAARVGDFHTIAHRGWHHDGVTENTYRAITLASRKGADAIEIDLRLTKDRKMVVHHDARFGRTTKTGGTRYVRDVTKRWITRNVRANNGQRLPFATGALKRANELRLNVLLEIKRGHEWDADAFRSLANVITKRGMWYRTMLLSFDGDLLRLAKDTDPRFRTVWIGTNVKTLAQVQAVNADAVSYDRGEMTDASVGVLRENGIAVFGRNSNRRIDWREYERRNVAGTLTDVPDRHAWFAG